MKRRILGMFAMCIIGSAAVANTALETPEDQMSYALGVTMGQHIQKQGVKLNGDLFSKGFEDGFAGKQGDLTEEQIHKAMTDFQQQVMQQHEEQVKMVAEQNKKEGETFLGANKDKEGVITTASGLQYKIIKEGDGVSPTKDDQVKVNYEGRLIDGTVFDSSFQRGEAATFPVSAVIPGWTEALQLMKPGAKWELYIPASLAYGERGIGQIGPNATLIFKVDLISVQ